MRTVIYNHFAILIISLLVSGSVLGQMDRPRIIEHPEFDVDRRVMKLRKGLDYATDKISEGRNVLDANVHGTKLYAYSGRDDDR